jgi:hypothetical protein
MGRPAQGLSSENGGGSGPVGAILAGAFPFRR